MSTLSIRGPQRQVPARPATARSGSSTRPATLPYRVDFENEATATAPAQQVVVTDQLDADLDWNTFQFTEVGFGDHVIDVPAGTQHFETTVQMTYNGQTSTSRSSWG